MITTASRTCSQTRPLFWNIRISSGSGISLPSPFFTQRIQLACEGSSQPGSAVCVEGLEAGSRQGAPSAERQGGCGCLHHTVKASQENTVAAGAFQCPPWCSTGLPRS